MSFPVISTQEYADGRTRLLTVGEVAEGLRLSPRTVHRLASEGELARVRVGRSVRVDSRDVDAFVERHREQGP